MYTILEKKKTRSYFLSQRIFTYVYQHHDRFEFDDEVCREHKEAKLNVMFSSYCRNPLI